MDKVPDTDPVQLELNRVIRAYTDIPESKRKKLELGRKMTSLFRRRAQKLKDGKTSIYLGAFDRLLRNGLYAKAYEERDFKTQRDMFAQYWAQEADEVSYNWEDRFKTDFLGGNVKLIDELENLMATRSYKRLYEIGCGHGHLLEYLHNRFPDLPALVGIDISHEQIEKNKETYKQPRICFQAADAGRWLKEHAEPGSIYLTNGGVLEYFLESELQELFAFLATSRAPLVIGLIECVGKDHDLEEERFTHLYGRELSFSHNYPHLLREAGLDIVHQSEYMGTREHGSGRWLRILAIKDA